MSATNKPTRAMLAWIREGDATMGNDECSNAVRGLIARASSSEQAAELMRAATINAALRDMSQGGGSMLVISMASAAIEQIDWKWIIDNCAVDASTN